MIATRREDANKFLTPAVEREWLDLQKKWSVYLLPVVSLKWLVEDTKTYDISSGFFYKKSSENPYGVTRLKIWVKSRTRKDGTPINTNAAEKIVSLFSDVSLCSDFGWELSEVSFVIRLFSDVNQKAAELVIMC